MSKNGELGELLTGRERQVLQLIAEGNTTKDIAGVLHLSVKTAESHRSRIMSKLDVHNIAGLVRYSIREGIIQA
jgi:DNA-binding NarL/FixJ family response regulator